MNDAITMRLSRADAETLRVWIGTRNPMFEPAAERLIVALEQALSAADGVEDGDA